MSPELFSADLSVQRRRAWIAAAILAILFHLLVLRSANHLPWPGMNLHPAPVAVQQIDPSKLDAIRKKWRDSEKKGLLMDRDQALPRDAEPPPQASYFSDRNIRVEKETRSKDHSLMPGPKSRASEGNQTTEQETTQDQSVKNHTPQLSQLGIPLNLNQKAGQAADSVVKRKQTSRGKKSEKRGNQYINDKDIPVGSENVLNAQESVYYSFYARLYETIAPIWRSGIRKVPYQRKVDTGSYTTQVDVVFDAQGNLKAINRNQGSGIEEFDQAVINAWGKIGRAPNPPKALLNSSGEIHTGWTFTVEVGAGFNLDSLPPERDY